MDGGSGGMFAANVNSSSAVLCVIHSLIFEPIRRQSEGEVSLNAFKVISCGGTVPDSMLENDFSTVITI